MVGTFDGVGSVEFAQKVCVVWFCGGKTKKVMEI